VGDVQRTTLYVLSSVVVALVGAVMLFAAGGSPTGLSISTSLIAGGMSSVGFVVIRYFDDVDSHRVGEELTDALVRHSRSVNALRRLLESDDTSRVFDRHPKDEIDHELTNLSGHVEIDVMGMTLRAFCRDWLRVLLVRGNTTLRVLVQDPTAATFAQVCHQESRDVTTMTADVQWVAETLRRIQQGESPFEGVEVPPHFTVRLRWCADYPTVTMIRAGGVVYARPRFSADQSRMFFERYTLEEGAAFGTFRSIFDVAWEKAGTVNGDSRSIAAPTSAPVASSAPVTT
jgi:hypothetical protein